MPEQLSEPTDTSPNLTLFDLWCNEDYANQLAHEIHDNGYVLSTIGSSERSLMQHWYPELMDRLEKEADAAQRN